MHITIEFCVAWNYAPRAAGLAEALVSAFRPIIGRGHPIEAITLLPSGNGRFEVTVDDELIYSKAATGQHTTNQYIIARVKERLK